MEEEICAKCKMFLKQGKGHMYPEFCRDCARRIEVMLDKYGLLNKLKRKKGVK